jgi:hypothetical protein
MNEHGSNSFSLLSRQGIDGGRSQEEASRGNKKASQSLEAEPEGHAVFLRTLSVEELG